MGFQSHILNFITKNMQAAPSDGAKQKTKEKEKEKKTKGGDEAAAILWRS